MRYITGLLAITVTLGLLSCEKQEPLKEPVATFEVSPTVGKISTKFIFDASESYDDIDASENLSVRWDWDGDGVYDTEYSKNKIYNKYFECTGTYNVVLEVMDANGWSDLEMTTINVESDSLPPNASFEVTPDTSCVNTVFKFNSGSCSDPNNESSNLLYRWDFNNDSIWDTPYIDDTIFYHKYTDYGNFTIVLEVKNCVGITDTTTNVIYVYDI